MEKVIFGKKTDVSTDSQGRGVQYDYSQITDMQALLQQAVNDLVKNKSKNNRKFLEEVGKILRSFSTNSIRIDKNISSQPSTTTIASGGEPKPQPK